MPAYRVERLRPLSHENHGVTLGADRPGRLLLEIDMSKPVSMHVWVSCGQSATEAIDRVCCTVTHDDGSVCEHNFVRRGDQCGRAWFPEHLRGIPISGRGCREVNGRTYGRGANESC